MPTRWADLNPGSAIINPLLDSPGLMCYAQAAAHNAVLEEQMLAWFRSSLTKAPNRRHGALFLTGCLSFLALWPICPEILRAVFAALAGGYFFLAFAEWRPPEPRNRIVALRMIALTCFLSSCVVPMSLFLSL